MNDVLTIAARGVATRAIERHGRQVLDGGDDLDLPSPIGEEVLPATVFIHYRASDGSVSQRAVTLKRVWREDGALYICGICHLRNRLRTFRVDRITELVCLATGEITDDAAGWLGHHETVEIEQKALNATRGALRRCHDELTVLAYIGRSDGFFDPDEIEVVVDHVMMASHDDIDREEARRHIKRLSASCDDLEATVERIARSEDRWTALRSSMRRLVDADRRLPIEEQMAVDEVLRAHEVVRAAVIDAMLGPKGQSPRRGWLSR